MSTDNNINETECKGLGGWLILLSIGIILNPINLIYKTYSIFKICFSSDTWYVLTDPSSPTYHVLLKPSIIFEFVANIIMIILSLTVLVLFFKKSKYFPNAWISTFIVFLIIQVIDIILCKQIPLITEQQLRNLYNQLFQSIIPLAIWFPYLKEI